MRSRCQSGAERCVVNRGVGEQCEEECDDDRDDGEDDDDDHVDDAAHSNTGDQEQHCQH